VSQDAATPAETGARLLDKRRAGPAMAALRQALVLNPDDHDSRLRLGKAHLLAADPFGAVAVFEELYARAPSHPQAAESLAGAYRRDARYGDVLALAAKIADPSAQLCYDMAMALTALGRTEEALTAFDDLLARKDDLAAAWYASHGPALDLLGWDEARLRLQRASACPGANRKYAAMQAAYELLLDEGDGRDAPQPHRYLVDGAAAIRPQMAPDCRLFGVSGNLLRWALDQAQQPGLVLEFGVRRGTSLTILADEAEQEVHGFDSFEGLPEDWSNTQSGVLTTGSNLPPVPANAQLHAGWFQDSLPPFFAAHAGPLRFANIDSDIYSSACTVLAALEERLQAGSILVFDEFIGNRSWRDDEFKAFHEFIARTGWTWRIIAAGPATKQVAIRLTA